MLYNVLGLWLIISLAHLISPFPVNAYLDPGSGSYLIQIIVASVAGFGYLVKANWARIKNALRNHNTKKPASEDKNK